MSEQNQQKREELALDALIAGAIQHSDCDGMDFQTLQQYGAVLSKEDLAAIDSIPANLIDKIVEGSVVEGTAAASVREVKGVQRLQTAMNRGDDSGELTDAARKEMEQKRKQAEGNPGQLPGGTAS